MAASCSSVMDRALAVRLELYSSALYEGSLGPGLLRFPHCEPGEKGLPCRAGVGAREVSYVEWGRRDLHHGQRASCFCRFLHCGLAMVGVTLKRPSSIVAGLPPLGRDFSRCHHTYFNGDRRIANPHQNRAGRSAPVRHYSMRPQLSPRLGPYPSDIRTSAFARQLTQRGPLRVESNTRST